MIVKSMARKTASFGQLIRYMDAAEKTGPAFLHNFSTPSPDADQVHKELLDNSRYLPKRKGGNLLYHEILSFSSLDVRSITTDIMEDLARRYLDARAPHALAYARAHLDTSNPHVHILISANNLASSRRHRISRARFRQIKLDLEAYQKQRYPFLEHSIAQGEEVKEKRKRGRQGRREAERERRLRAEGVGRSGGGEKGKGGGRGSVVISPTRKEVLTNVVLEQMALARSGEAFSMRLKMLGIEIYRRGRAVCIRDLAPKGRRYRLRTLGLEESFREAARGWATVPKRMRAIEGLQLEQAQRLWHELGYRTDILSVLQHPAGVTDLERRRMETLRQVLAEERDRYRSSPGLERES